MERFKSKNINFSGSYRYCLLFCIILIISCSFNGSTISSNGNLNIGINIVEDDPFNPDEEFHIITEIRNSKPEGRIDVLVKYDILDLNDNIIFHVGSKTVAIETLSSFNEEINLPSWIKEGSYQIRGNVSTLNGSSWNESKSRQFIIINVQEGDQGWQNYLIIIMLAALIVTGGGLVFEHRRISKMKVTGEDLKKFVKKRK